MNRSTDLGVESLSGDKFSDLEYADEMVILDDSVQAVQTLLSRLEVEVFQHGTQFAPNKRMVLIQDCQELIPRKCIHTIMKVLKRILIIEYLGVS